MSPKKQGKYRFEEFEIDLAQRSLRRQGNAIAVSTRTFDLLVYFVLNPQRIVTQDELIASLWPDAHLEESNLGQHIFLLRKAISAQIPGQKLIVNTTGPGYEFTAGVTKLETKIATRLGTKVENEHTARQALHVDTSNSNVHGAIKEKAAPERLGSKRPTEKAGTEERTRRSRSIVGKRPSSEAEEPDISARPRQNATLLTSFFKMFKATLHPGPWQLSVAILLLIALALGLWQGWRWFHRSRRTSFNVVVMDFQNATGELQFDRSLETALTLGLQQSPYLAVASPHRLGLTQNQPNSKGSQQQTVVTGREVCKRLNDQAYLTGSIVHLGLKYLVSVEAVECETSRTVARSKALAGSPEAVLELFDRISIDLRQQLGEPSETIARYSKPLFGERTVSLGAMKAYADASHLAAENQLVDAIPLYQLALRLDPKLTMAYADLGAAYSNLGEHGIAVTNLTKAYETRDTADEPIRLFIIAAYNRVVTGDLQAAIRNEQQGAEEYPNNPAHLGNLADLLTQAGKPALAIDPARRALAMNPGDGLSYVILARAQMHLGQLDEAAATCKLAIDRHVDDAQIHAILLQIAFLRLDQPAIDEQMAWAKDKPDAVYLRLEQSSMNFAMGKVKAGLSVLNDVAAQYRAQGDATRANRILQAAPRAEAEMGNLQTAMALLTHLPESSESHDSPENEYSTDIPVAWAEVGETARAEPMLQRELEARPFDTILQQYQAPQIRAAVALVQHKPDEAIDDMQVAVPYDLRAFDALALRGRAYLANKQPVQAEAEFHKILDHPGVDPLSYNYPLAQLGLARALAQQQKTVEASFAYKVVFQIWKDADADMPRLKEAKAEYARLNSAPIRTVSKQQTK